MPETPDPLSRFSEPTRTWFRAAFADPTPAQAGAWASIASGHHTLVVAPTGSGKTLSAFLASIDKLLTTPTPDDKTRRTRVLYVSPLKALAVDVERNLRAPLAGIRQTAERLGFEARSARTSTSGGDLPDTRTSTSGGDLPDTRTSTSGGTGGGELPELRVGIRSGDTPANERRTLTTRPPDILITTPESLFLMLTSRARESLRGVETVIIDEVHAVAGTKRGAHLAITLERLDVLLAKPAQRIGLSATVRPTEEVARFLGGRAPVEIVAPPAHKSWDLQVVVPVEDMTEPDAGRPEVEEYDDLGELRDPAARRTRSIWPHVEERVAELIRAHRSTIVFANSRRTAERLTARLNEIAAAPVDEEVRRAIASSPPPAQIMAQSGASSGAAPLMAKAHHGSVSKEQRAQIEDDLKAGRLPAVVATSSLELGIDMGAVDQVLQIASPPSVASALQRVGRAGHQVGETSKGVFFPQHRGDLAPAAVSVARMRTGAIESLRVPANPLDVLAQQVVAATALDEWDVDELFDTVRRAASYAGLPRSAYEAVLDLLAGRYPSDEFAELRPRITWDRVTGRIAGRPGAQRLAVTSGGTIPDRGLYGVFLVGGDVFALGATSWRI
uniref:DEAD/DEAH box helicase n=1 Tax=Nocardioides pelophilus TaxID=2172019 RepID=UPI0028A63059